ncbi:MAG TPA: ATP-binding cassette domain-containing protein [Planctomycetota bacterium]
MIDPVWSVDLRLQAGRFALAAAFESSARVVALFGPSGAGKSTLVECLAGVRRADGVARLGGRPWLAAGGRAAGAPRVGWVPQDGALFPHLDVRGNLLFGARQGGRAGRLDPRVLEVLALGDFLDRSPAALSGGERQRVALGRALHASPEVLLLDEPLAGLDLRRRARAFRHLLAAREAFELPMLYVSHDPAEVLAIAEHVVMLDAGRVCASGPPRELLAGAQALRLLDRLGFENVLRVKVDRAAPGRAPTVVTPGGRKLIAPAAAPGLGPDGWLAVRAEDVLLASEPPRGLSARNVLAGTVVAVEEAGERLLVHVDAGDPWIAALTHRAVEDLALGPGRPAWVVVKTHAFHWLAD